MKQLEEFLSENSWLCWLFRIAIVFAWIFWATGWWGPFAREFKKEMQKSRPDPVVELKAKRTLSDLVDAKIEKAELLGKDYGAKEWFSDYKEIVISQRKTCVSLMPLQTQKLHEVMMDNYRHGYVTDSEISVCSQEFQMTGLTDEKDIAETRAAMARLGWHGFLAWVMVFYLRSLLLALLLYLIRMAERSYEGKGILETILADKLRFIYSVVFWFIFLFKYPYNVVREIRVEAELRRLGNFFRPLTEAERLVVRQVAANKDFGAWLANFREENAANFRRTLAVALLALIFFALATPVCAAVITHNKTAVVMEISQVADDDIQTTRGSPPMILPQIEWLEVSQTPIGPFEAKEPGRRLLPKGIDHVPVFSLLVAQIGGILLHLPLLKGELHENDDCVLAGGFSQHQYGLGLEPSRSDKRFPVLPCSLSEGELRRRANELLLYRAA